MVPSTVDKETLLRRWIDAAGQGIVSELSSLNPGADHTLSEIDAQEWFATRVLLFLSSL
jgi:hypothetical protein